MTVVQQRTASDCGLASLVIFMVERLAREVDPDRHGLGGMYNRELVAMADLIAERNWALTTTRRFNCDRDEGVLRVRWIDEGRRRSNPEGHFVALIDRCIHCPSLQVVLPWRDYLEKYEARAVTLLRAPEPER